MDRKSVIVIGGGPAGMLAAASAGSRGHQVTLVEKNIDGSSVYLGKKLRMTGNGRCNVTNDTDVAGLIAKVPNNGKFLYSAFQQFSAQDTIELLHRYGVQTHTEAGDRVFPRSNKSKDVVDAFYRHMTDNHVCLRSGTVTEVRRGDKGGFLVYFDDRLQGEDRVRQILPCDVVVIATGGISYPNTGSTGDGYRFAVDLGHQVTSLRASLVGVTVMEKWTTQLQGISLEEVDVTLGIRGQSKKKLRHFRGDILFTHYGITGPAVYLATSHMVDCAPMKYELAIDCLPEYSREELEQMIARQLSINGKRQIVTALHGILPKNMILVLLNHLQICYDKYANQITGNEREKIVDSMKGLRLSVHSLRSLTEATVTSGGVTVKEVHPGTMESKLIKGLYFAGEVLDVDGYTGGFNIQIALSTGFTAGSHC